MVTIIDFVAELIRSAIDLVVIFVLEVALSDPLSFVSFLLGAGLTTAAVVAFGYLLLGAALDLLGAPTPSPGRTRRRRD